MVPVVTRPSRVPEVTRSVETEDDMPEDQIPAVAPDADRPAELRPLHWGVRLAVLIVGGLLILIGIAGLVLPGIQGIVTIVLGLAVTSLASEFVHRHLRRLLSRWPKAHRMMERFRRRVHRWLSPARHRTEPESTGSDDGR